MKISAVLILFSLSALTSAVAIAHPVPDAAPAPESTTVPPTDPPIDLNVTIADDDEVDDGGSDDTILERDVIPDSLERREPLWERALAALQRRETAVQATERLTFSASIGAFLAAKAARVPRNLIWHDDGCTGGPERPGGFNFLPSCQRHDFGYKNFKAQGRFTFVNRLRIDNKLRSDMYHECEKHGIIRRTACKRLADIYYHVVRAAGGIVPRTEAGGVVPN